MLFLCNSTWALFVAYKSIYTFKYFKTVVLKSMKLIWIVVMTKLYQTAENCLNIPTDYQVKRI